MSSIFSDGYRYEITLADAKDLRAKFVYPNTYDELLVPETETELEIQKFDLNLKDLTFVPARPGFVCLVTPQIVSPCWFGLITTGAKRPVVTLSRNSSLLDRYKLRLRKAGTMVARFNVADVRRIMADHGDVCILFGSMDQLSWIDDGVYLPIDQECRGFDYIVVSQEGELWVLQRNVNDFFEAVRKYLDSNPSTK